MRLYLSWSVTHRYVYQIVYPVWLSCQHQGGVVRREGGKEEEIEGPAH